MDEKVNWFVFSSLLVRFSPSAKLTKLDASLGDKTVERIWYSLSTP